MTRLCKTHLHCYFLPYSVLMPMIIYAAVDSFIKFHITFELIDLCAVC